MLSVAHDGSNVLEEGLWGGVGQAVRDQRVVEGKRGGVEVLAVPGVRLYPRDVGPIPWVWE